MLWCTEEVWRWKIRGITSWRLMSGASWTCRIIRSWSHNCFETFESIRNDSKARKLGAIQIEVNSCFKSRKGKVFCIVSWQVKSGYTMIMLSIEYHWVNLAMHQQHSQISTVWSFCSAFGEISWVQFIIYHIQQTLPHPIITCSNWWHMAWLSSIFILMK